MLAFGDGIVFVWPMCRKMEMIVHMQLFECNLKRTEWTDMQKISRDLKVPTVKLRRRRSEMRVVYICHREHSALWAQVDFDCVYTI